MSKIDEFKEYARRRIVERLREDKENSDGQEDALHIESYDEGDSFYEGSDEEYKEFLDGLDVDIDGGAEPVENTGKINLGETINVREVIDRVKEKAGSIAGAAAAKMSGAVEKTSGSIAGLKDKDDDETCFEKVGDELASNISDMKTAITDTVNDSIQHIEGIDERLGDVSDSFNAITGQLAAVNDKIAVIEKHMQSMDIQTCDKLDGAASDIVDLKAGINSLKDMTAQIRDAVSGVSKLSDSVFDMKNSQQNTKNALTELQTAFTRLKKKTVMGIVIISIIGFITIALEVINLLA